MARRFALLRRAHGIGAAIVPKIKLDGLEVDLIGQRVTVGGRDLQLTPIQQTLLYRLAANAGRTLSREDLLSSIWGEFEIDETRCAPLVAAFHAQLADVTIDDVALETVAGKGYRFKSQESLSDAAK